MTALCVCKTQSRGACMHERPPLLLISSCLWTHQKQSLPHPQDMPPAAVQCLRPACHYSWPYGNGGGVALKGLVARQKLGWHESSCSNVRGVSPLCCLSLVLSDLLWDDKVCVHSPHYSLIFTSRSRSPWCQWISDVSALCVSSIPGLPGWVTIKITRIYLLNWTNKWKIIILLCWASSNFLTNNKWNIFPEDWLWFIMVCQEFCKIKRFY